MGGVAPIAGTPVQAVFLENSFFAGLVYIWLLGLVAASIQYFGWSQLFKTLLAYGLAARLPVILIMALAILGRLSGDGLARRFPLAGILPSASLLGLVHDCDRSLLRYAGGTYIPAQEGRRRDSRFLSG